MNTQEGFSTALATWVCEHVHTDEFRGIFKEMGVTDTEPCVRQLDAAVLRAGLASCPTLEMIKASLKRQVSVFIELWRANRGGPPDDVWREIQLPAILLSLSRSTPGAADTRSDTMAKLNKQMALKKSRGQGMTEYIIIVALIAIAAIGVITLFGDNIKALFGMSADALAGDTQVEKRTSKSQGKLEKKKLTDFAKENSGY